VNVKPVGNGQAVLKYLAPYVYRVAISDNRIVDGDERAVTYRVRPTGARRCVTRTVPGERFVQGFAQHILPQHFRKVRHYGWMHGTSRMTLDRVRWRVWLSLGWTYWLGSGVAPPPDVIPAVHPRCRHCGGPLVLVSIITADGRCLSGRTLPHHVVSYLDSG
jgi:hypothetical protein